VPAHNDTAAFLSGSVTSRFNQARIAAVPPAEGRVQDTELEGILAGIKIGGHQARARESIREEPDAGGARRIYSTVRPSQ
jgi:hypothetical protein